MKKYRYFCSFFVVASDRKAWKWKVLFVVTSAFRRNKYYINWVHTVVGTSLYIYNFFFFFEHITIKKRFKLKNPIGGLAN